jgi:hypothetical protein
MEKNIRTKKSIFGTPKTIILLVYMRYDSGTRESGANPTGNALYQVIFLQVTLPRINQSPERLGRILKDVGFALKINANNRWENS